MPTKIGMFLTAQPRSTAQPTKSTAQPTKSTAQPNPTAQPKSSTLIKKQSSTPHSMRTIMNTPRTGFSSCGH